MIARKKWISLLLVSCLLLTFLPVYALAEEPVTEVTEDAEAALEFSIGPIEPIVLGSAIEEAEYEEISPLSASPPNTIARLFPDSGLARAVAAHYQYPNGRPATVNTQLVQAELDLARELDLSGRNIQNLQGMQFFRNVRVIDLSNNRLSSLSPLAGLTRLEVLSLNNNNVDNLHRLSGLTRLEVLHLHGNRVSSLQPLTGLTRLTSLALCSNRVSSISALSRLTRLEELSLNNNSVSNLQPLSGLTRLHTLFLLSNNISDLQPLSRLTRLNELALSGNRVSNLQPLAGLTALTHLALDHNRISDLRPLSRLARLETLYLGYQLVQLPRAVHRNPLTVENNVFNIAGGRVPPLEISHNGTYAAPNFRWAGLPTHVSTVGWVFGQEVRIGSAAGTFWGGVEQPLVDSATPFVDVPRTHWAHNYIEVAYRTEIMTGLNTTPRTFNPGGQLTRAQMATILYRMARSPAVTFRPIFSDVPSTFWGAREVTWAADRGVVEGRADGTFAPNAPITREQFVLMLWRYARNVEGRDVTVPDNVNLNRFPDGNRVSSWSRDAMLWAVHNGVIGEGGTLNPQGNVSRATGAAMLVRYSN